MKLLYDVIVVGAGHAGCEAACASAGIGAKTCLITMDMNKIAQMSCNPAIGGIAKGQIVREIDALGGHMGEIADLTAIQFRMLNRSKGPAMWSPRAQCDRSKFIWAWREMLDNTPNLSIWQDQVTELITSNDGTGKNSVAGVRTIWGVEIMAKSVIITTGTFLNGLMHIGRNKLEGGRCSEPASKLLTESIARNGIRVGRMKTGTPVRIDGRSVHFEDMAEQPGDEVCGIQSIGPRYCPSIETKLVTFADKDSHLLFLEPEGVNTQEYYLNGFSSSLPIETQIEALKLIPAFRDLKIYRPGYAIEYDYFDPTQLYHTMESKVVEGLYLAGQVNGTTGYEEAAGQGLIAGINAALKLQGKETFVLHRDEAYIGVLIDDIVTKGVDEPYRMFTSRAEYRILLRQDDADARLTEKSYSIGLATQSRLNHWLEKKQKIEELIQFCNEYSIKAAPINDALVTLGTTPLQKGCKLTDLVARPQVGIQKLSPYIPVLQQFTDKLGSRRDEIIEAAEIRMKYSGYIMREREVASKMQRLENIRIRGRFDYPSINSLSTEARQKLASINPETLAQASRIPGVSPSDINVLLILLGR